LPEYNRRQDLDVHVSLEAAMSPPTQSYLASACALLVALLGALASPHASADVRDESDVDLTLAGGGRDVTNTVGMKLKRIPAGKFLMGAAKDDTNASADEKPQHEVEITKDFYLGVCEVTQKQWKEVMGDNPSYYSRNGTGKANVANVADRDLEDFPVEYVTWHQTQDFLKKLGERKEEKSLGRTYRLPTEAEWEYACRAGARTYKKYHFGDQLLPKLANYSGAGVNRTCKVGSYAANEFGLHDMHGNVWEWIADWHDPNYYANSPKRDPKGPPKGTSRVLRGGAWSFGPNDSRSAHRLSWGPENKNYDLGFRVVLVADR
jgi:formylglycine-generating enzyme required for sulfatase activity